MEQIPNAKGAVIKNIYLYLVTFVALMMMVFSCADLINTILRSYVFTHADQDYYQNYPCAVPAAPPVNGKVIEPTTIDCQKQQEENRKQTETSRVAQRERDLIRDLSFLIVGLPLFLFHWRLVRRKVD